LDGLVPTINSNQDSVTFQITAWSDDDRQDVFVWSIGDGTVITNSSSVDVSYVYPPSVTGTVIVTLTVYDFFGEQDVSTKQLWINPLPVVSAVLSLTTVNIGMVVTLR